MSSSFNLPTIRFSSFAERRLALFRLDANAPELKVSFGGKFPISVLPKKFLIQPDIICKYDYFDLLVVGQMIVPVLMSNDPTRINLIIAYDEITLHIPGVCKFVTIMRSKQPSVAQVALEAANSIHHRIIETSITFDEVYQMLPSQLRSEPEME